MTTRTLVIFARDPRLGRVKTRLAAGIGPVAAWAFYRQNLAAVCRRLSRDPRWRTVVAVTPDNARAAETRDLARIVQGPGNLGDRMQRVFDTLDPGPVVIVGSDIPGISTADIAAAFRALGNCDAVMGPSSDGGYWLIGLKRTPRIPRAFGGVRWSAGETGQDTRTRLEAQGCSLAFVRELDDVDDADDYRLQRQRSFRRGISSTKLQGM